MRDARPLLLLDVDGPLNPYAAEPRPDGYTAHLMRPLGWEDQPGPLRVLLNPGHGAALLALPYELVWATTWRHEANAWIAPRLGLPCLPVVEWHELHWAARGDGVHWKTRQLVDWADGRAFAWVDDEIGEADREYVAACHPAPALLHRVDPAVGLLAEDFALLGDWARETAGARAVSGRDGRDPAGGGQDEDDRGEDDQAGGCGRMTACPLTP
ncbi:HAD domain-containing protein [Planomonospora corallina]|uniref:HAD domain-containing protein n=1 Tax=Planomonospora corallina TaxID=1806052 RepID=A0ABV8I6V3_9ACTN